MSYSMPYDPTHSCRVLSSLSLFKLSSASAAVKQASNWRGGWVVYLMYGDTASQASKYTTKVLEMQGTVKSAGPDKDTHVVLRFNVPAPCTVGPKLAWIAKKPRWRIKKRLLRTVLNTVDRVVFCLA